MDDERETLTCTRPAPVSRILSFVEVGLPPETLQWLVFVPVDPSDDILVSRLFSLQDVGKRDCSLGMSTVAGRLVVLLTVLVEFVGNCYV
jgi:hypothetical protein